MRKNSFFWLVSILLMPAAFSWAEEAKQAPEKFDKQFTVVAIESEGAKFWIPSTLIVKKGDKVKITLINTIKAEPNTHGYAIDAFGIKEVIARGEPKAVSLTADKTGVFTIYCHQHPKHIGGQLLVME